MYRIKLAEMRFNLVIFYVFSIIASSFCQADSLSCYNGFFERSSLVYNEIEEAYELGSVVTYTLINDGNQLEVIYDYQDSTFDYSYILKVGFYDLEEFGHIENVNQLKPYADNGDYFVEISSFDSLTGHIDSNASIYYSGWSCDYIGFSLALTNRVIDNSRIDQLPYQISKSLYEISVLEGINYFQEFLDQEVRAVCVDELELWDEPFGDYLNAVLPSGELVEVLEQQGGFRKLRSLRTGVEGWGFARCFDEQ